MRSCKARRSRGAADASTAMLMSEPPVTQGGQRPSSADRPAERRLEHTHPRVMMTVRIGPRRKMGASMTRSSNRRQGIDERSLGATQLGEHPGAKGLESCALLGCDGEIVQ